MRAQRGLLASALALCVGLALMIALRGFTVDDALISARFAHHIATGHGARFNVSGPATDGVTPLLWPWLLAPFSSSGPLSALLAAKWMGALAWAVGIVLLAVDVSRTGTSRWRHLGVPIVAATPAAAAWAVSGMETGLVMALGAAAVALSTTRRRRAFGAALAGVAASMRPELLPWALVIGAGHASCSMALGHKQCERLAGYGWMLLLAALPFAITCAVRWIAFGSVAPLSLRAKPSDLTHGVTYAAASLIVLGPPVAVLAPGGWRRLAPWPRWLLVAFGAHAIALTAAGGDWMPLSRLFVPVLPSLAIVFAQLAGTCSALSNSVRLGLCLAGQIFVLGRVGPAAARVGQDRMGLIEQLRGVLSPSDRVASVDIGWVGAASDAAVIDLAGVTDPVVASLPGGHTTKALSGLMLANRGVTKVVFQLIPDSTEQRAWNEGPFARGVEKRLASDPWVKEHFVAEKIIGAGPRLRYWVATRRPDGS
jgi:hypothetical protein